MIPRKYQPIPIGNTNSGANSSLACAPLSGAHLQLFGRGGGNVEHFLYIKKTVEIVPEHPHRTHRVNLSSITSESSVGTMVMCLSLDEFQTFSGPKSGGAS